MRRRKPYGCHLFARSSSNHRRSDGGRRRQPVLASPPAASSFFSILLRPVPRTASASSLLEEERSLLSPFRALAPRAGGRRGYHHQLLGRQRHQQHHCQGGVLSTKRNLGFLSDLSDTLITFNPSDILGQGRGLRPTLPPNALDSVLERLDRAHYLSTTLLLGQHQGGGDALVAAAAEGGGAAKEQQVEEEEGALLALLEQRWGLSLRRLPSSIPGVDHGLFLTRGAVPQGAVITFYPGLIYSMPYDLEGLMHYDEALMGPCPPEWLRHNPHLLRFHDEDKGQHILVDGNPSGRSAINFIKACMRRKAGLPKANLDWLIQPKASEHTTRGVEAAAVVPGRGGIALVPHKDYHTSRYVSSHLGMGHLIKDVSRRVEEERQNVHFHLCALPSHLPKHLSRFVPNVHFSELLGDTQYTVLVTAAMDLEVKEGDKPIELLVAGVHRHGYPLR